VSLRDVGLVAGETHAAERCSSFSSAGRTPPARPSVRGLPRGLSQTHSAVLEAGGKLERAGGVERAYSAQTENIQYQFSHPKINLIIQLVFHPIWIPFLTVSPVRAVRASAEQKVEFPRADAFSYKMKKIIYPSLSLKFINIKQTLNIYLYIYFINKTLI
jgi:hypothetical protein